MKGVLSNFKPGILPVINTGASHYAICPDPIHYVWIKNKSSIYTDDKVVAPLELAVWND